MEKVKEIKLDKKTADIIVLDEGISKKGLEPLFVCCLYVVMPGRG